MPTTLSAVTLSRDELAAVDAFWQQRIYFDGKPLRRVEVLPRLAVATGMTERAALFALISAEIVGQPVVAFDKSGGDDGGWRTTPNGHHIHIGPDGEPDKGNPHVIGQTNGKGNKVDPHAGKKMDPSIGREIAGRLGHAALAGAKAVGGAAVAGAKGAAKGGLKLAGKAAKGAAKGALAVGKEAVKSGAEILGNNIRTIGNEAGNLADIAVAKAGRAASAAAKGGLDLAGRAAKGAVKGGLKLAGKAAVGTVKGVAKGGFKLARGIAKRIGFGIEQVLKAAWATMQSVQMSARTRAAVQARFAA